MWHSYVFNDEGCDRSCVFTMARLPVPQEEASEVEHDEASE